MGGTGPWWAGKGLVDADVNGPAEDFGVALVGDKAAFGVGNPDTTLTSTTAINDGQWHHVAATRDAVSGRMQLYVDGSLQASAQGPNGIKNAPPHLRLGSIRSGAASGFLSGTIDDVQIFGRALSADEIPPLMNHAPALSISSLGSGSFRLTVRGDAGPDYTIETAASLTPAVRWTPVFTNQSAIPPFLWTNANANHDPQRFYRVRWPP
jgi:hypothetical protein